MTRTIGLDFGEKRIGVSVSDPLGLMAFGGGVIENKGDDSIVSQLKVLFEKYGDVGELVVGLPLNLKGEKGIQAQKVQKFIDLLRDNFDVPINTFDERMTTAGSTRKLLEAGLNTKNIRSVIDEASAMSILQDYLDTKK